MESRNKNELIRVVRSPDGEISLDLTGKKSGRGAYICHDVSCLKIAKKAHRIERSLDCTISEEIYTALESQLEESNSSEGEK